MTNEQMAARLQNLARGIEVIAKIGPAYGEDNENDLAALCAGAKALCEVDQMRAERDAANDTIANLRRELAEARRDGERLAGIVRQYVTAADEFDAFALWVRKSARIDADDYRDQIARSATNRAKALRAAIDAARGGGR